MYGIKKACFVVSIILLLSGSTEAQVITARWFGTVRDQSGGLLPGAAVSVSNEGTGMVRKEITGDNGEFVFEALPVGRYTLQIAVPGFTTLNLKGIELAAAQSIRNTYVLQVGETAESVTVEGRASLLNVASSEQRESISSIQVMELPLSRRNVTEVLKLATGVDVGGPSVRINGQGVSGAVVTVDGTDANANPSEGRSMEQFKGRNYIDVMSIQAVQEVQLLRGVLPAEYGGALSGQVNLISKSGTNQWHGGLFENYRSHVFNARDPFRPSQRDDGSKIPKDKETFNQFGGSIGGPILRDKAFFFLAYEGYRETLVERVSGNVPTPDLKNRILRAMPLPETKMLMDVLPPANVPIDDNIGRFEGAGRRERTDDHFVVKGDVLVTAGSNLSVTYTRNRPFGRDPSFYLQGANDRTFRYAQDRLTVQHVAAVPSWTFETRFGFNHADTEQLEGFITFKDPAQEETIQWQRRIPMLAIRRIGSWGRARVWQMEGTTYSVDQKISHRRGKHLLKFGGRYVHHGGSRTDPANPSYSFDSMNDLLANSPGSVQFSFGSHGPYDSRMYEIGFFAQDDWRLTPQLTLNLGLRHDFYSNNVVEGTGPVPVVIKNLEPPTDWQRFNFGARRPFDKPIENDGWPNLGPRLGFAYDIGGNSKTVVRGGFGILFAAHVPGVLRQSAGHPDLPSTVIWSKNEARRLGVRYPMYAEQALDIAIKDVQESGKEYVFSILDPNLQNPYSMHYQLNIQRQLATDLMWEVGFVGVRGVKYPMHRRFNLPDRITGDRPNPNLIPGGYYVDNSENSTYSSLQTSLRKRFSRNVSFDLHYTWGKTFAYVGADVGVPSGTDSNEKDNGIQDFFNLGIDRGNPHYDATHQFTGGWIYQLPYLNQLGNAFWRHVLGGWQMSGIFSARTGTPAILRQSCSGSWICRPDYVGGDPVHPDWKANIIPSTCQPGTRCHVQYLNPAAFETVPDISGVAIRPGNASKTLVRNPGLWLVDLSLAKNFKVHKEKQLQFRIDMFNAFNHVNWGALSFNARTIDHPEVGRLDRLETDMRTMQVGVRLVF